jgi:hypothetical protein
VWQATYGNPLESFGDINNWPAITLSGGAGSYSIFDTTGTYESTTGSIGDSNFHCTVGVAATAGGSSDKIYVDGTSQSFTSNGSHTFQSLNSLGVGNYTYHNGKFAEIAFYNVAVTPTQAGLLHTYFSGKWGTP